MSHFTCCASAYCVTFAMHGSKVRNTLYRSIHFKFFEGRQMGLVPTDIKKRLRRWPYFVFIDNLYSP